MPTVNTLERKNIKNENKMHFTSTSAALAMLGTFKLPSKDLVKLFSSSPMTHSRVPTVTQSKEFKHVKLFPKLNNFLDPFCTQEVNLQCSESIH